MPSELPDFSAGGTLVEDSPKAASLDLPDFSAGGTLAGSPESGLRTIGRLTRPEFEAQRSAAAAAGERARTVENLIQGVSDYSVAPLADPFGTLARGMTATGRLMGGVALDVLPSRAAPAPGFFGGFPNTRAAMSGQPLPTEEQLSTVGKGALDALTSVPVIGTAMGLEALGVPGPVAFGAPMAAQSYSQTGNLADAAKSGILGALLPGVSKWAKESMGVILSKSVATASLHPLIQKGAEATASQVALNTLFTAMDAPELATKFGEDPKQATKDLARQVVSNLVLSLPEIPGLVDARVSSETSGKITDEMVDLINEPAVKEWLKVRAQNIATIGAQPVIRPGQEATIGRFLPEAEKRNIPFEQPAQEAPPVPATQPQEPNAAPQGPIAESDQPKYQGNAPQVQADGQNRADNAPQYAARPADSVSGGGAESGAAPGAIAPVEAPPEPKPEVPPPAPPKPPKEKPPAEPPEGVQETPEEHVAKVRAKYDEMRAEMAAHTDANLKAAGTEGAVELKSSDRPGDRLVITPDATNPGMWRVTHLLPDGPWGHYQFASREAAIRAASGERVKGASPYYSSGEWTVSRVSKAEKVPPKVKAPSATPETKQIAAPPERKLLGAPPEAPAQRPSEFRTVKVVDVPPDEEVRLRRDLEKANKAHSGFIRRYKAWINENPELDFHTDAPRSLRALQKSVREKLNEAGKALDDYYRQNPLRRINDIPEQPGPIDVASARIDPRKLLGAPATTEAPAQRPPGFRTAKDVYELTPTGTTTRHGGPGESQQTFYVTPGDAKKLASFQERGGPQRVMKQRGQKLGVRFTSGENIGYFDRSTLVRYKTAPEIGLVPVEIFSEGRKANIGKKITELLDQTPERPVEAVTEKKKRGQTGVNFFVRARPDGVFDILDAIQRLGGIKSPQGSKHGEFDGYHEAFGVGVARLLRRTKPGEGMYPDDLYTVINSSYGHMLGFHMETTDDLYARVSEANQAREKLSEDINKHGVVGVTEEGVKMLTPGEQKKQEADQEFFEAILDNQGKTPEERGAEQIPVSELSVGDTFKIKGEEVRVVDIDPDTGEVQLDDGRKYGSHKFPAEGVVIYPDKGTLKEVPRSTDFLPPGEQGKPSAFFPAQKRDAKRAVGIENVRRVLDDPNNGMSPEARRVANAWLRQPVFDRLNWDKLALNLQDRINGGALAGSADVLNNLIRLARTANPEVLPHELLHFLYEMLPAPERRILEMLRQEAIDRAMGSISSATGDTAGQRAILESMRPPGQQASVRVPGEFYHLQNASEFLAHTGSERFASEIEAMHAAEGRPLKKFMLQVRQWVAALMDGIRNVLGRNPTLDQIHRDLLAGKYDTAGQAKPGEQGMLAQTGEEAKRIMEMAKVRGPRAERVEATELQGQVGFPSRKITDMAFSDPGFTSLDPKTASAVLKRLGSHELEDVQNIATRYVPRDEFHAARATLPPDIWPDYAKQVGQRFKILEDRFDGIAKEHQAIVNRMASATYQKKVQRANILGTSASTLELLKAHFQAQVTRALAESVKIMKAESRNTGGAEAILADIQSLETKREYAEAVKSAIRDIVETFSQHEDTIQFMLSSQATVPEILRRYADLRNVSTPDQIVLQWAAQAISTGTDTARELLALTLLKNNQKVRDQYTKFAQGFADEFAKNPYVAAKRIVKGGLDLGRDEERARAAFRALNKGLVRDAQDLEVLQTSDNIAKRMMDDPETVAYRKEVFAEGKIQDRPRKGAEQQYDSLKLEEGITLPDGTNTGPITLYGDAKQMAGEFSLMEQAAEKIGWHIAGKLDETTADYWQRKLDYIQNVLTSSRMMQQSRFVKPFGYEGAPFSPLGMSKHFVDSLGTREAARLRVSLTNHSRAIELALNLMRENMGKTTLNLLAAARSHYFDKEYGPNEAVHQWFKEIGNALYASWQHPEGGKTVGDWLRGYQITKEDFDMLRFTASVTSRAFDIIQKGLPKELKGLANPVFFRTEIGQNGVPVWVQATRPSELTVTRVFSQEARDFVKSWIDAKNQTREAKVNLLDGNFWNIVQRHIADRAVLNFEDPSPYEDAYKAITADIDQNGVPYLNRNMDWLIDQLHQITQEPKEKLLTDFLTEFDRAIKRLPDKLIKEEDGTVMETLEMKNAFTQGRTPQLAGDWLYNHGFRQNNDLINLTMGATGYYYQRAAEDMLRVKVDLERQRREMGAKIAALVNRGISARAAQKQVIRAQEEQTKTYNPLRLEGSLDTYAELERKIEQTDKFIKLFTGVFGSRAQNTDFDIGKMRRIFGAQTGSVLMSYLVALHNLGTGWYYLGRQVNLITGANIGGSAKGFYAVWMHALPKFLGATAASVIQSPGRLVEGARMVSLSHAAGEPKRIQLMRLFEPLIEEVTQKMYERVKLQKELFDRGYTAPTYTTEDMMAKLSLLAEGGAVREKELHSSLAGQLGFGAITLYDAMILTPFGKPFLPRYADAMLNVAATKSAFDALEVIEQQLRKTHQLYRGMQAEDLVASRSRVITPHGSPGAPGGWINSRFNFGDLKDPINQLAPEEVFGKWFGKDNRTNTDLEHLKAWFEYGNVAFQDAAMRFLGELEKGNTKAKLLSPDDAYVLANALVEQTNKASALNRSLLFKQGGLWEFVAPLMGFNVNLWAERVRSLSRAAVDPKNARLLMWMSIALGPGILAAAAGTLSDVWAEMIARQMHHYLLGEERATRQPWEREGTKSQAIGWILSMLNPEPFVATLANTLINDMPSRASFSPQLFLMGRMMDFMGYVSGAWQSGDWTTGLGRLIKGTIPISAIIINKLPGVEGSVEGSNARRLLRRFGPQDLLRPPDRGITPGQSGTVTPLTPIVQRAYNAAIRGDMEGVASAKAEYVKTATEMGLPNPEQRLAQALSGRDAFRGVFRVTLTDDQKQAILAKMSPDQQELVNRVEQRLDDAVQAIKGGSAASRGSVGSRTGSALALSNAPQVLGGAIGRVGSGRTRSSARRIRPGGVGSRRGIARVRGYNLGRGRAGRSRSRRLRSIAA